MAEYNPACKFDTADIGFDVGAFDKGMLLDSESFSIVDSVVTDGELAKTESFSVTDDIHFIVSLAESFSIVDSVIEEGTESIAESFSIADATATDGEEAKAEGFSITDSVHFIVFLTESFSIADSGILAKYIYMIIRKINVTFSAGNYESNIELED